MNIDPLYFLVSGHVFGRLFADVHLWRHRRAAKGQSQSCPPDGSAPDHACLAPGAAGASGLSTGETECSREPRSCAASIVGAGVLALLGLGLLVVVVAVVGPAQEWSVNRRDAWVVQKVVPGQAEADVVRELGQPWRRYGAGDGELERLLESGSYQPRPLVEGWASALVYQPRHDRLWVVYLDAAGRVVRVVPSKT